MHQWNIIGVLKDVVIGLDHHIMQKELCSCLPPACPLLMKFKFNHWSFNTAKQRNYTIGVGRGNWTAGQNACSNVDYVNLKCIHCFPKCDYGSLMYKGDKLDHAHCKYGKMQSKILSSKNWLCKFNI